MSRRKPKLEFESLQDDEVDSCENYESVGQKSAENHKEIPYRTLAFILVFFVMGSVCICFGILITSGYFGEQYQDRGLPALLIGILMFIPGGYYFYILIFILCKREGFSFEDIPML